MRVSVLGAVEVEVDGRSIALGTRKQRALMAALALSSSRAASTASIVDLIWGDDAPPGVSGTLQAYVAGLRRALEPDRPTGVAPTVLVTRAPGYALEVPDDAVDAVRFERGVARARDLLGRLTHDLLPANADLRAVTVENVATARQLLAAAARLWRGTPYLELADTASVVAERARLDDLHLAGAELEAVAALAQGDHQAVAAELEALVVTHPLRERLSSLRAIALTRAGRQADALAALRDVRAILADELGIDPGEELRRVETAVLQQDPALEWHPPVSHARHSPATGSAPDAALVTSGVRRDDGVFPDGPSGQLPSSTRAVARGGTEAAPTALHRWPLVGRTELLTALDGLLVQAENGEPQFAALVGEPGIGKSRLCAELAAIAASRGARVLVGRCSQDLGAPALWPWAAVLGDLPGAPSLYDRDGTEHPGLDDVAGEHFYTWDTICRALLDAAARETVCVVLDDLHWADASSLRVLRHLASTAERGRLLVLTTWRSHPPPAGPHAEAAEALARRHALRLDLAGLTDDETGELFAAVAGAHP